MNRMAYPKCSRSKCCDDYVGIRKVALVMGISSTISLLTVLILTSVVPSLLTTVYHIRKTNQTFFVIYLLSAFILLVCCAFLFVGLRNEKAVYVFVWVGGMTIFWNFHLICGIMSIVDIILNGKKKDLKTVPARSTILVLLHGVWLIAIVVVWNYWRKMTEIIDAQNLVEFIKERHSSARSTSNSDHSSFPRSVSESFLTRPGTSNQRSTPSPKSKK